MHLTIVLELYLIYFEVIFKVPMNENEMLIILQNTYLGVNATL